MYIDVMNMNLLSVVTPLSIYIGWSTQKTLWEIQFAPVNMKICCRRNVSKHRNIKDCYKYITLEISLEFGILDMMRIIIWGYQQRDLLPIWVSIPLEGQRKRKRQVIPLLMSVWRKFLVILGNLRSCLMKVMCGRSPNMNLLKVTFILQYIFISVWWDLVLSIYTLTL